MNIKIELKMKLKITENIVHRCFFCAHDAINDKKINRNGKSINVT